MSLGVAPGPVSTPSKPTSAVDRLGKYQRVSHELRALLAVVRPGYRFGAKQGRVNAAYRWTREAQRILDAIGP